MEFVGDGVAERTGNVLAFEMKIYMNIREESILSTISSLISSRFDIKSVLSISNIIY